ncbi:low-density lipoprotein receptor-related protein-like isoform X2 [Acanthaster planci]|uniref:Low-density lipoprotein receptor-related protein-like isoform X2 n=1 Tax=Acanthaster planci TaxID=133434 RepID=A0A8B8A2C2_ACAPL|nr:low-density lipoprotein receptor-related protein-like isoform X2 [Acanthaster planci]
MLHSHHQMSGYFLSSRPLSLASLCLIFLGLCSGGASGIWFGRPGEGWMRNRVIWQRPGVEESGPVVTEDRAQHPGTVNRDYWSTAGEEDDKRNGQLTSNVLFNLIRGKGRTSTTKRSAECESNEFRCDDGSCIPETLQCNGEPDCLQGTDEDECGLSTRAPNCSVGFKKCALQEKCYDIRYTCDGHPDCLDASDELNCASILCPAAGYIKCEDGWQCYNGAHTCDGWVDCRDGSDEKNCGHRPCLGVNQVKCADKEQCYREDYTCDAIIDCADGSDEHNCSTFHCGHGFKKCANGLQCFSTSKQCDGIVQCVDGSDEADCPIQEGNNGSLNNSSPVAPAWHCQHEPCADGSKCYLANLRCDGISACDDGSDEWGCATFSCPAHKVKCEDRSQCIWEEWLCDGEVHCNDGSEERGCSTYVPHFIDEVGSTEYVEDLNATTASTFPTAAANTQLPTTSITLGETHFDNTTASGEPPDD